MVRLLLQSGQPDLTPLTPLRLTERSLTGGTILTVKGILTDNPLLCPSVCSSRKSAQKRTDSATLCSGKRLLGFCLEFPGEFSDKLPVEVGVAVLAKTKTSWTFDKAGWVYNGLLTPALLCRKDKARVTPILDSFCSIIMGILNYAEIVAWE